MVYIKQQTEVNEETIRTLLFHIFKDFPHLSSERYIERTARSLTHTTRYNDIINKLILNALDEITVEQPDWTFVAARLYLQQLYNEAAINRSYDVSETYRSYYELQTMLVDLGIYDSFLLEQYTKEELQEAGTWIDPKKDKQFTYIGLRTLVDRYLAKGYDGEIYELPQERFLTIALTLMVNEPKEKRMELVKEAYWALSNQYMTVATPTYANAGKSYGQLSSCFIDTVDDSLIGIYESNTDVARLSKGGGGIGVYLGKIRARNSDIKGFKGVSSGVIPWMRQLNNTAVSVDQLGTRQGSIAVYLDVWHKDIFSFLDAKLNNGDERQKCHDLFYGVCIPDLFMEQVEKRGDWYLFDPHEVKKVMGWKDKNGNLLGLEDFYDEERGAGSFREKYEECINHPALSKERVPAIEIMKRIMKSQLETGTPYMFYRDEANRMNPNKHAGMIYSSNLCTEIMQNMSPTTVTKEYTQDGEIIIHKKPGDFVVCNLSSIHLARAVQDDVLERLIPIQVRMLDNVIDLNEKRIEVLQAVMTNKKYRAIGLGAFSWHHLLALKGIKWNSEESVRLADELFEKIAYLTIKASMELAKEKGAYPAFKGSDWHTGKYFELRGYHSHDELDWDELKEQVMRHGIRNGYLMAPAPNASTSVLANGTASCDPIFNRLYFEEKKNYKIPVTVPDLNAKTFWFYDNAYEVDQKMSIRQNAARQKHVDQSLSFNLYVYNTIKAKDLLDLHLTAWKERLKSTYYVRSTAVTIEECDVCSS
ncbi:ribonucleotide-diphosphate reductase subunit alpha [Anoxybacillus flavithermus NBRC 109594]|uniref:Ribonucleoside-diphosphate reductase n=1 Tax=Anoxybacillus flavithermus NBRC 109594 TaxID=1315967 RepID=R4FDM2_9BACL|nr:ribonucleoside-diphosphate reductase subunit alpha [Anoxybacillus flavithermus]GAC90915.1 ribonucleotide-diphosphate reductase subunit alpha [Anoxybacillus flavithermus NBRC 109594]